MKDTHTLRFFRKENLLPKIAQLPPPQDSAEEPIRLAARKEAKRILAEHRPLAMDKGAAQMVKSILRKYDEASIKAAVPTDYLRF